MGMAQRKKLKTKKIKVLNKVFFIISLLIIAVNVIGVVVSQKEKYLSSNYWQRFPDLEKTFLSSQYVNKHPKGWIPDETAFSYAAGKLITGTSPVLAVPDAPPVGKYLIGLSAVLFNNDSTIILITAVLCLIFLFFLGKQVFHNNLISIVPPLLLSFEPIFKNQLIYTPLLDLFQLLFLILTFIFFNLGNNQKKSSIIFIFFLLSNLFLGLFISTKFFITGVVIAGAWCMVLILNRQVKKLLLSISSFALSVFLLLLSYARVFAFGYSIHRFLGIQKWVFLYHKGQLMLPLSVWPLILLNKWYVWWGDKPIISDPQWVYTWPVITIISLVLIALYLLGKIKKEKNIEIIMSWIVCYLVFLSFGQIISRYFVILIPMLYIITVYGIVSLLKKNENSN
jgi:hypothetical protein